MLRHIISFFIACTMPFHTYALDEKPDLSGSSIISTCQFYDGKQTLSCEVVQLHGQTYLVNYTQDLANKRKEHSIFQINGALGRQIPLRDMKLLWKNSSSEKRT